MADVYVRKGIYEDGNFRVVRNLAPIDEKEFEEVCKELEPYLLCLEETAISSYDDSDDERVTPSSRYTIRRTYREINPRSNSESLLITNRRTLSY